MSSRYFENPSSANGLFALDREEVDEINEDLEEYAESPGVMSRSGFGKQSLQRAAVVGKKDATGDTLSLASAILVKVLG